MGEPRRFASQAVISPIFLPTLKILPQNFNVVFYNVLNLFVGQASMQRQSNFTCKMVVRIRIVLYIEPHFLIRRMQRQWLVVNVACDFTLRHLVYNLASLLVRNAWNLGNIQMSGRLVIPVIVRQRFHSERF